MDCHSSRQYSIREDRYLLNTRQQETNQGTSNIFRCPETWRDEDSIFCLREMSTEINQDSRYIVSQWLMLTKTLNKINSTGKETPCLLRKALALRWCCKGCPDGFLKKRRHHYKAKGFPARGLPGVPMVTISWSSPTFLGVVKGACEEVNREQKHWKIWWPAFFSVFKRIKCFFPIVDLSPLPLIWSKNVFMFILWISSPSLMEPTKYIVHQ